MGIDGTPRIRHLGTGTLIRDIKTLALDTAWTLTNYRVLRSLTVTSITPLFTSSCRED